MKVMITGASGQLGQSLISIKPNGLTLFTPSKEELNLTNQSSCRSLVRQLNPDFIINCGAYTAVDTAEIEPEIAFKINANAPKTLSESLLNTHGRLLQISTDYVFNGNQSHPYQVNQSRSPINVYGQSKAKGEAFIEEILGGTGKAVIMRTSWLVSPIGNNFVLTMLKLHQERDQINVVADQVGCLTSTKTLANACWEIIALEKPWKKNHLSPIQVFHWCDSGIASWHDISVAIGEIGNDLGLIEKPAKINRVTTDDYPTLAKRPNYSVLDCTSTRSFLNLPAIHWRHTLFDILMTIKELKML